MPSVSSSRHAYLVVTGWRARVHLPSGGYVAASTRVCLLSAAGGSRHYVEPNANIRNSKTRIDIGVCVLVCVLHPFV